MNENRPTVRAPAHLVLLPTAAPLPVIQHPRRGRYPRGVISIKQARKHAERRERFVGGMQELERRITSCQDYLAGLKVNFEGLQEDGVIQGERT